MEDNDEYSNAAIDPEGLAIARQRDSEGIGTGSTIKPGVV